jgi:SAM-dependent methyltransferase
MSDPNNPFPVLYHHHHQNFTEDLPFWQSLARWMGSPILELGCGTGRVLIPLAQNGHTVYGIDHSPAMLDFLQQRIPTELQANIHLIEANMVDFEIEAEFRLVLLPCNTYSTFDSQARAQILSRIFRHLQPGGVFAVSMPNPNLLAALQTNDEPEVETIFYHPESSHPVQVSSTWEKQDITVTMNWHYDHLLPDGKIERLTATATHYLATMEDYITEMIAAGFTIQSTYRNFETGAYKPDASYLIILAKK